MADTRMCTMRVWPPLPGRSTEVVDTGVRSDDLVDGGVRFSFSPAWSMAQLLREAGTALRVRGVREIRDAARALVSRAADIRDGEVITLVRAPGGAEDPTGVAATALAVDLLEGMYGDRVLRSLSADRVPAVDLLETRLLARATLGDFTVVRTTPVADTGA